MSCCLQWWCSVWRSPCTCSILVRWSLLGAFRLIQLGSPYRQCTLQDLSRIFQNNQSYTAELWIYFHFPLYTFSLSQQALLPAKCSGMLAQWLLRLSDQHRSFFAKNDSFFKVFTRCSFNWSDDVMFCLMRPAVLYCPAPSWWFPSIQQLGFIIHWLIIQSWRRYSRNVVSGEKMVIKNISLKTYKALGCGGDNVCMLWVCFLFGINLFPFSCAVLQLLGAEGDKKLFLGYGPVLFAAHPQGYASCF